MILLKRKKAIYDGVMTGKIFYICPMHSDAKQERPGICQECGMNLVPALAALFMSAVLMLLYYFPVLTFPYIAPHSFIVDDHIIYALALLLMGALQSGRYYGLYNWCANLPICSKVPKLREWLG